MGHSFNLFSPSNSFILLHMCLLTLMIEPVLPLKKKNEQLHFWDGFGCDICLTVLCSLLTFSVPTFISGNMENIRFHSVADPVPHVAGGLMLAFADAVDACSGCSVSASLAPFSWWVHSELVSVGSPEAWVEGVSWGSSGLEGGAEIILSPYVLQGVWAQTRGAREDQFLSLNLLRVLIW